MQHDILLMLKYFMTESMSSYYTVFIVPGGTIAHTEICTGTEADQLTRIIIDWT